MTFSTPIITPPIVNLRASDSRRNSSPRIPLNQHSNERELEADAEVLHSVSDMDTQVDKNFLDEFFQTPDGMAIRDFIFTNMEVESKQASLPESNSSKSAGHSKTNVSTVPAIDTGTVRGEDYGIDTISPASEHGDSASIRSATAQTAIPDSHVTGKRSSLLNTYQKTPGEKFASVIQDTLCSLARLPADEDVTGQPQPIARRESTASFLGIQRKRKPESTPAGSTSQRHLESDQILENRRTGVFEELRSFDVHREEIAAIINESMEGRDPTKPKPDYAALGERFKRAAGFTEQKEKDAEQWYKKAGALYSLRSFFTGATGVTMAAGLAAGGVGAEIAAKISAAYYSLGPIGTATGLTPAFSSVIDYIRAWECTPVLAPNIETDERYSQIRSSLLERGKEAETMISSYKDAKEKLESSGPGGKKPTLGELKTLEQSMTKASWNMEFDRRKKRIKDDLHLRQIYPAKYQTGARVAKTLLSVTGSVAHVPAAAAIPLSLGTFAAGQAVQAGAAAYDEGRKLGRIVIMNLKYGYKTFLTEEGQKVYEAGGEIKAEHIKEDGVREMFMTRRRILVKGVKDYATFRISELEIRAKKLAGDLRRIEINFANRNPKGNAAAEQNDPAWIAKNNKLEAAVQEKKTCEKDLEILKNGLQDETNGSWNALSPDGSVRRMLTSGPEMMLKDAMRRYRSLEDQLAEVMHQVAYAAPLVGTMQIPYAVEGSGLEGETRTAAIIGGVGAAGAISAGQYVGASIERYRQRLEVKKVLKQTPVKEPGLKNEGTTLPEKDDEATASIDNIPKSSEDEDVARSNDSRSNSVIRAFRKVEPTLHRFMARKPVRLVKAAGIGIINTATNIVTTPPSYLRTRATYQKVKLKHNELKENLKELRAEINHRESNSDPTFASENLEPSKISEKGSPSKS